MSNDDVYAVVFKLKGRSKTWYVAVKTLGTISQGKQTASKKAEKAFRTKYPELCEEGYRQAEVMMVPEA